MSNEQEKWRRFLQPVITGLVALMTALTLYVQSKDSSNADVRMSVLEQNLEHVQTWSDKTEMKVETLSQNFGTLTVQLAQVLVKMDNIIETLKEMKLENGK